MISTQHNKELLMSLYQAVVAKRWHEVERLLSPGFVDHSPELAPLPDRSDGGRAAFLAYFQRGSTPLDGAKVDIQRMLSDGELVMVHYRLVNAAHPTGLAVVDLFRVVDGVFVEHWDVLQPIPPESKNPRAFF
ncbi:nuclear transport factor 2 family protein [Hyalangium versicolor]|uniref:nuclear transport factor 2 family protein n=1 Tax=Hyalangium versicolor TaxID=2861190 RepID=UPI001CCC97C2|nr:nuclear transport factor 2 family protein [Hyalangium versicolor]